MTLHHKYVRLALVALTVLLSVSTVVYAATQSLTVAPGDTWKVVSNGTPGTFSQDSVPVDGALASGRYDVIPTPTPVAMIEGVPECTDHNATAWHGLVKKDGSGAITCSYGHEHHDNPTTVNDIFGAPGAWYGATDSISYPWMTMNSAGVPENTAKHEGYKWFVMRDLPCVPFNSTGCVTAWRIETHTRGDVSDANTRFHSFAMELQVKSSTGVVSKIRHGGHLDFGYLELVSGGGDVCPNLQQNPPTVPCDGTHAHRDASVVNPPAPHTAANIYTPNWYADHGLTSLTVNIEEFGPIDYNNLGSQLFFPPNPNRVNPNNSQGGIRAIAASMADLPTSYVANGVITFNGYTDRHGAIVQGCSAPAMDCVPFKVEGAPRENYWLNIANNPGADLIREHDIQSPVTNKSLVKYPN